MERKRIVSLFMELLYPGRCPLCGKIAKGFCEECYQKMKLITTPFCFSCGKQLWDDEEEYCTDCRKRTHLYERGRGLFRYEGQEKEMIHRIKYENKREYLNTIADFMSEYLKEEIERWEIDLCIPIPMFKKKKRKRGYNQAEILADLLGERLCIPVDKGILLKVKDTEEQKVLSRKERRNNLRDAFYASGCQNLRILLVDDVYTTGSTINAATEVLLAAGAEAVWFVTICIGNGNS